MARQFARVVPRKPSLDELDDDGETYGKMHTLNRRRKQSTRYNNCTTIRHSKRVSENHKMSPENTATEAAKEAVDNGYENLDAALNAPQKSIVEENAEMFDHAINREAEYDARHRDDIESETPGAITLEDVKSQLGITDPVEGHLTGEDDTITGGVMINQKTGEEIRLTQEQAEQAFAALMGGSSTTMKAMVMRAEYDAVRSRLLELEEALRAFAAVHQMDNIDRSFGFNCGNPYHPHIGFLLVHKGQVFLLNGNDQTISFNLNQVNALIGKLRRVRDELKQQTQMVPERELLDSTLPTRFILEADPEPHPSTEPSAVDIASLEDRTELENYLAESKAALVTGVEESLNASFDSIPEIVEQQYAKLYSRGKHLYDELQAMGKELGANAASDVE